MVYAKVPLGIKHYGTTERGEFILKWFAKIYYTKCYQKWTISMNFKITNYFIFEYNSLKRNFSFSKCVCMYKQKIVFDKRFKIYFFFMNHKLQIIYLVL